MIGCGEKKDEWRQDSKYWDIRLEGRQYDFVKCYHGNIFDDDMAWVLVQFLTAENVVVHGGRFVAGPYSNGYQKTFVGNSVWRIRLGGVVRQVHELSDVMEIELLMCRNPPLLSAPRRRWKQQARARRQWATKGRLRHRKARQKRRRQESGAGRTKRRKATMRKTSMIYWGVRNLWMTMVMRWWRQAARKTRRTARRKRTSRKTKTTRTRKTGR